MTEPTDVAPSLPPLPPAAFGRTPVLFTQSAPAHAAILDVIRAHETFLVTSHARPDGDAIGSALGLAHLMRGMGKQVTVIFSDPIPRPYLGLGGVEGITAQQPAEPADVCFIMECDSVERTGYHSLNARMMVNIDHHVSGKAYCDVNWIDATVCAVGALVYELALSSGVALTPDFANCIYAAILTDTGGFTFSCTSAQSFHIAEHLLLLGADANSISRAVYFSHPESKMRLLGTALSNLRIEGEVAWSVVSQLEMQRAKADAEDCEGVVNFLIGIEGISAAAFFREQPNGDEYRLSLRSKGELDVAAVAELFGGGGHRTASGCTLYGALAEIEPRVIAALHAICPATADAGPRG